MRHGAPAMPYEAFGAMSGRSLEELFRAARPELTDDEVLVYRTAYREIYEREAIPATRFYPGALATLRAFRRAGLLQATVTGKRAADCERILRGLGIAAEIDVFLGGDSVARPKPAPDLALLAMERLGARPEETVVVGDTRNDMQMGKAAGARTLLVLWGYERDAVPEADEVVRTWKDLRDRILRQRGALRS